MTISEWWNSLGPVKQRGLGAAIAAALLISAAATVWLWRPGYTVLYSDLTPDNAAPVIAELEALKADYQLDPQTKAISVRSDEQQNLRAALAERGLPAHVQAGFELFDKSDFGLTEFAEKINYQRGLEGELARTLMSFESVRFARVHLTLPNNNLFKRDQDAAKAVVTLVTTGNQPLSDERILSVQNLVAAAVGRLTPDHVAVLDARGVTLSKSSSPGTARALDVEQRIVAKEGVEQHLKAKIEHVLAPLFPNTSLAISVDVSLSMARVSTIKDNILSPSQNSSASRPRSAQTQRNVNELLAQAVKALAPGEEAANSEEPQVEKISPLKGKSGNIDWQTSRTHEEREELPGSIERVSVGIIVPDLGANDLDQLHSLVSSAIGMDPARGDTLAIYPMPASAQKFRIDPSLSDQGAKSVVDSSVPLSSKISAPVLWITAGIAVFLLVLLLLLRLPRRAERAAALPPAQRDAMLLKVREWLNQRAGETEQAP